MELLQLTIATAQDAEEALSEYLTSELLAQGVEIRRRSDFTDVESRTHGETIDIADVADLPEDIEVTGYFSTDRDSGELKILIQAKLAELASYGLATGSREITEGVVADTDWNESWKQYYHVVSVTRDLTIVPEWLDYEPKTADEHVIRLDPGLSFGTGTHITTQLALLLLEKAIRPNDRVLDVGTGSGILSIAAEKLGAKQIVATDIDEQAMTASKENISLNNSNKIELVESDLLANVTGEFDLIIANILTEILLPLTGQLAEHLAAGGQVIMAGIDIDQLRKLEESLNMHQFTIKMRVQQERWVALLIEQQKN